MSTLARVVDVDCQTVCNELVNYTEGDLAPELLGKIERHLKTCRHCKAVFDGAGNIVRLLGDSAVFDLPDGFSQRLRQKFAALLKVPDHS